VLAVVLDRVITPPSYLLEKARSRGVRLVGLDNPSGAPKLVVPYRRTRLQEAARRHASLARSLPLD
jgi:hypothetical protein